MKKLLIITVLSAIATLLIIGCGTQKILLSEKTKTVQKNAVTPDTKSTAIPKVRFYTSEKRETHGMNSISELKWDKLNRDIPEWIKDAKFGIFTHWGPYCIPLYNTSYSGSGNSWYARWMYVKGHTYNDYQVDNYGPLQEFGYADFFKLFTAEDFNANEWAEVVAGAGAKFAGPVAMHHGGYAMWNSDVTPWNSMETGPKKDIAGELMRAYRAHGLKTLASFHHAYNICGKFYGGNNPNQTANVDFDSDLKDPEKALLYGNFKSQKVAEQFWLDVLKDFIVKNKPDQLYFDWGLKWVSKEKKIEMASFYYDFCEKNGIEGIVAQKSNQIPEAVSMRDYERGGAKDIMSRLWQTDDSPGPWMYKESADFKGSDWILSVLLDVVSKNGVLLLNVAPGPSGKIPDKQQSALKETGEWLKINGEAVYETQPWKVYFQGPNSKLVYRLGKGEQPPEGSEFYPIENRIAYVKFTKKDVRFTQSKDGLFVYAIVMQWPDELLIESLDRQDLTDASTISLLGTDKTVKPNYENGKVTIPVSKFSDAARKLKAPYVFKISRLK